MDLLIYGLLAVSIGLSLWVIARHFLNVHCKCNRVEKDSQLWYSNVCDNKSIPEGAMSQYKHLTRKERESLLYFLAKGYSISRIAKELERNKSTISRELRRNTDKGEYYPSSAEQIKGSIIPAA